MKTLSPALLAFLQARWSFYRYDLVLITLANGHVVPVSNCPMPIVFDSSAFQPAGGEYTYHPTEYGTWERGAITSEAGYQPSANSMTLTVTCQPEKNILYPGTNTTLMQTVAAGLFDAATVQLWTFYCGADETPAQGLANKGVIYQFLGTITEVKQSGRSKVEFTCTDMMYLLNLQFPKNLVTSGCFWSLFDGRCTLTKASYACNNSVAAGSNQLYIKCASNPTRTVGGYTFSGLNGDFSQGTLTFTSGQNKGLTSYIKLNYASSGVAVMQLAAALPLPVATSDTFTVYPGCNKTYARCTQFVNTTNFGGFPFVPNPELAV